jgi:hypothetical protein
VVAATKLVSEPVAVAEQPQRSHTASAVVEEVDHVAVEDTLVEPIVETTSALRIEQGGSEDISHVVLLVSSHMCLGCNRWRPVAVAGSIVGLRPGSESAEQ